MDFAMLIANNQGGEFRVFGTIEEAEHLAA